jgi:hypothetical protein
LLLDSSLCSTAADDQALPIDNARHGQDRMHVMDKSA